MISRMSLLFSRYFRRFSLNAADSSKSSPRVVSRSSEIRHTVRYHPVDTSKYVYLIYRKRALMLNKDLTPLPRFRLCFSCLNGVPQRGSSTATATAAASGSATRPAAPLASIDEPRAPCQNHRQQRRHRHYARRRRILASFRKALGRFVGHDPLIIFLRLGSETLPLMVRRRRRQRGRGRRLRGDGRLPVPPKGVPLRSSVELLPGGSVTPWRPRGASLGGGVEGSTSRQDGEGRGAG